MQQYPESHHLCAEAVQQCSEEETLSSLCRSRATVSRRRNSVILAQGPCNSVQRKIRRQARHEVRTSGPALEGSIVSPLVNTMGGLSGGRRGGDVSGAASAPSLVVARLLARALALDLACGIRCPPFCHQEGIRQRRLQHTPTQELSHAFDCAVPLGELSALFPSHLRQEPRCFSFEGSLLARGRISSLLSAAAMLPPVLPRVVRVIGSRQNTIRVHPSLPSTFLHGFAMQYRTCDTNFPGALFNTLFSQYCLRAATCSAPNSFVEAKLRRNATHTYTKGGPSCS